MKAMKLMVGHIHRHELHDGCLHETLGVIYVLVLRFVFVLSIPGPGLTVLLQGNVHLLTMMMVMDVHGYQRHNDSQAEHEYGQSFLH